jgi:hypothetical protein
LRQSYEAEKQGKARLEKDVESLKTQFQKEMDAKSKPPRIDRKHSTTSPMDPSLSPEQQEALARYGANIQKSK